MQNIKVIGVDNLRELIEILNRERNIEYEKIDLDSIFSKKTKYEMDFCNIKGQKGAKRALEVAAARRTQLLNDSEVLGSR